MTTFERIALIVYALFAWSYMFHAYMSTTYNKTWYDIVFYMIISASIGIICFPVVFAEDIWKKLNKEEQQ